MNGEWLLYDPMDKTYPWRENQPYGWHRSVEDCTDFFDDEVSALAEFDRATGYRAVTLDDARQIEVLRCL